MKPLKILKHLREMILLNFFKIIHYSKKKL